MFEQVKIGEGAVSWQEKRGEVVQGDQVRESSRSLTHPLDSIDLEKGSRLSVAASPHRVR